jgi:hypothetical protein
MESGKISYFIRLSVRFFSSFNCVFLCRINDEVLSCFMLMCEEYDNELCVIDKSRIPSHFFSSFFMQILLVREGGYCYQAAKRYFLFFN